MVIVAYIAGGFPYPIPPYKDGRHSGVPLECIGQLAQTCISSAVATHIESCFRSHEWTDRFD